MRGVYTAQYTISTLTAARTLMYLTAPATAVVEILTAEITNIDNETNEQLEAKLHRITSLGTPTATTVVAAPTENGDQASAVTVKGNVTASEPTYAAVSVGEQGRAGFATLAGWNYRPTPEERMYVPPSASVGLRLMTAPTTPGISCIVSITFREIG